MFVVAPAAVFVKQMALYALMALAPPIETWDANDGPWTVREYPAAAYGTRTLVYWLDQRQAI